MTIYTRAIVASSSGSLIFSVYNEETGEPRDEAKAIGLFYNEMPWITTP